MTNRSIFRNIFNWAVILASGLMIAATVAIIIPSETGSVEWQPEQSRLEGEMELTFLPLAISSRISQEVSTEYYLLFSIEARECLSFLNDVSGYLTVLREGKQIPSSKLTSLVLFHSEHAKDATYASAVADLEAPLLITQLSDALSSLRTFEESGEKNIVALVEVATLKPLFKASLKSGSMSSLQSRNAILETVSELVMN